MQNSAGEHGERATVSGIARLRYQGHISSALTQNLQITVLTYAYYSRQYPASPSPPHPSTVVAMLYQPKRN